MGNRLARGCDTLPNSEFSVFLLNFDKFDIILLNCNRISSNFDRILKYGPDLPSVPPVWAY
jgi:hypothetical protein